MEASNERRETFLEDGFDLPKVEGRILEFWENNHIFDKTLEKTKDGRPFTFYDGPPFATGLPHYGHILASTIKDVIPRYQTMKGRFVRRRWGWDCHGLPIEEIVERKLGISGKKQIEEIGIEKFNAICRSTVLQFADDWGKTVRRIARWVDFDNSYKTMDRDYMESVWWAFKQLYDKELVYEGRKVLMYCSRCETPVSNFEVAMDNSYKDVTEESVFVKFKVKPGQKIGGWAVPENTYLLAWTTTPWTLPGNVALAVGENIDYVPVSLPDKTILILAKDRVSALSIDGFINETVSGKDLVGLEYEPLFDVPAVKSDKTFKVYPADFVSTEEGTGIVHTAVVYGEEDYELGQKIGLPVVPLLDDKGKFNDKAQEFLRGSYFKDADALVIADLEKPGRNLLFKKETHTHSYPHCWRCGTPLYYNAIPAWFVNIQKLKPELLKTNSEQINWYPDHLKHGRYEKSVEAAPDWNISRNRYWGNPIPVWKCEQCSKAIVAGSIADLGLSTNVFYFTRHGEAKQNILGINSSYPEKEVYDLTEAGVGRAEKLAEKIKALGGVDMIFASDLLRTKRTAEIVGKALGMPVQFDERLREYNLGVYNGKPSSEFDDAFSGKDRWTNTPDGGENWTQIQERMVGFIKETDRKYQNKKILVVSHGDPLLLVQKYYGSELPYPQYAQPFEINVGIDDLHRPYIDEVVLKCPDCGGAAKRVKEIFDSWFEAGSMPFAEYHYPFDYKHIFEHRFPGQFVAEYIAQTRAWFYVMHVMSLVLFGKAPFENVVTTGTILAEDGSKMSKSKGNYPDPWLTIEKYGVDALRFYLMNSTVMQADNLNFSERELGNVYRKIVLIMWNVLNYYLTYSAASGYEPGADEAVSTSILDRWITSRTQELVNGVADGFDKYDTVHATRLMAEYVDDLSTWYLRRSRGRSDKEFFATLRRSLIEAAKVMAPVMPYISELVYMNLNRDASVPSVHLAAYPESREIAATDKDLLRNMEVVREAASLGQALRKTLEIPVRQPLPRLAFLSRDEFQPSVELINILLSELNVKAFDPKLNTEQGEAIKTQPGVKRIMNFYLDTSVSEELRLEGLVRGLERAVQELRKKQGLKVGETAVLTYSTLDVELKKAVELFNREKTYVTGVKEGTGGEELAIDGKKISITITK